MFPESVAIIPARGGSKGVPRKNVRYVAGKPLIAWAIEACLKATSVSRVVVSTDDNEIADISKTFGAEVVWRPSEISGDSATSEEALAHAIDFLEGSGDYSPELTIFVQCTAPLVSSEDIDGTVKALLDEDCDTALAAMPFHYFLWTRGVNGDFQGINHDKRVRLLRQQQESPQLLETGSVYVMRTDGFKKFGHRFFGKTTAYQISDSRHVEIDDESDLAVASSLLESRQAATSRDMLPDEIRGIVFDFDGVFTDNRVFVLENGMEAVASNRSDGMGISRLKKLGISMLVLSSETNPVVSSRCEKLEIPSIQGITNKLSVLRGWAEDNEIRLGDTVYVGNDINDLECIQAVGCGIVVGDAHPTVKSSASLILSSSGGNGAIREVADMVEMKFGGLVP